MQLCRYYPYKI